jgi:sirohydrochlorin ferrochelatase
MIAPALLAVSHGTSSAAGQAAVDRLVAAVAARLPDRIVRLAHVDVQQPDVTSALAALPPDEPVVIVPLLLSAGYHVRVDLARAADTREGVATAAALGPDPRLAEVLASRLGPLTATDRVVLASAGSSDERANEDCRTVARMLADRLGRPVTTAFLAAVPPRLPEVLARSEQGDAAERATTIVASYLLAPGYFHDLTVRQAGESGGCQAGEVRVTRPLLDDDPPADALVDLVVDRSRAATG